MREGLACSSARGIEPATVGPIAAAAAAAIIDSPDWLFNNFFLKTWKIDAKARSSMADDLAAGRKTEVDYLNGELVAAGRAAQHDAPVNRAIVELVHKAEAGASPGRRARREVLGR